MKFHPALMGCFLVTHIATAQSSTHRVIPASHENLEGNSLSAYPLKYEDVRWQMVIDSSAIAKSQALIGGLSFRPDGSGSTKTFAAKKLQVTITFYEVTTTPSSMVTTFASNIGKATGTVVFKGTVNLPAVSAAFPLPTSFSAKIPFASIHTYKPANGNLLIDWQETGAYQALSWSADGMNYVTSMPSGLVNKIWEDKNCANKRGDQAYLSISNTGQGVLGGSIQIKHTMKPSASANLDLMILGLGASNRQWGPFKLPLALGPLGYNSCMLATDLSIRIPTLASSVTLAVPSSTIFSGVPIYFQGLALDSKAAALVPTYNAYQVVIRPNAIPVGVAQTVYATKPSTRAGVGFKSPHFFFPVLRMDGRLFQ